MHSLVLFVMILGGNHGEKRNLKLLGLLTMWDNALQMGVFLVWVPPSIVAWGPFTLGMVPSLGPSLGCYPTFMTVHEYFLFFIFWFRMGSN